MEISVSDRDDNNPHLENHEESSRSARYLQHSYQLLSLFPTEVWDHICSFLDSTTFQNLNNSSPFFRELFLNKRVLFLYPPVLEILLEKFGELEANNSQDNSSHGNINPILSFLGEHRSVCKTWRRTIDQRASIWSEEPRANNITHQLISTSYMFTEITRINNFLEHFNITHSSNVNPFIGKYIFLQFMVSINPLFLEISTKLATVLEKYGHHLQTCELGLMYVDAHEREPYQSLVRWLNCMPNLETLKLQWQFYMDTDNVPEVNVHGVPLTLKHLKKLIIKTINPHDYIRGWSWIEHYNLRQVILDQEKLEYLQIPMFTRNDVEILKNVKSPLKTLVAIYYCGLSAFSLLGEFTSFSEKFSGSLEYLKMDFRGTFDSFGYINIMQDSFHGRLYLPKVRTFEIHISSLLSLDFLLGMQDSLEELIISCVGRQLGGYELCGFSMDEKSAIKVIEGEQIVKFLGYQEKMLESNIWSLFPKLAAVYLKVSGKCVAYKRKDWKDMQKL